jgi:chromate transporter
MNGTLLAMAALFSQLSLVAVGGGNTILPEMQRQVVAVHGWMGPAEFAALFALAQASPGPNMLVATLIGWRVAGGWGAAVATLSLFGPPAVLTFVTSGLWERFRERPWRHQVQAGLMPVTSGLVLAASLRLGIASAPTVLAACILVATAAALLFSRVHPLLLFAAAACAGALGLG